MLSLSVVVCLIIFIENIYGLNITDCNFNLNRLSTFESCYCDASQCIFDFNLNEQDTLDSTSFITCDHRELKLDSPDTFTQCIINCNAINSCNDFIVHIYEADDVYINCHSDNSCNLLETHINEPSLFSINESTSFIQCSGTQSCDNLGYFCHDKAQCDLECVLPGTCNVCNVMSLTSKYSIYVSRS